MYRHLLVNGNKKNINYYSTFYKTLPLFDLVKKENEIIIAFKVKSASYLVQSVVDIIINSI